MQYTITDYINHHQDAQFAMKVTSQVFQIYDTKRNGALTRLQFPNALNCIIRQLGKPDLCFEDVYEIFDILDINGDQTISKVQFTSLITKIHELVGLDRLQKSQQASQEDQDDL